MKTTALEGVIPAQAGNPIALSWLEKSKWIPACAGMTPGLDVSRRRSGVRHELDVPPQPQRAAALQDLEFEDAAKLSDEIHRIREQGLIG